MIVCSCRWISDSDYPDKEQLRERLLCDDWVCGTCIRDQEMNSAVASEEKSACIFSESGEYTGSNVSLESKKGGR